MRVLSIVHDPSPVGGGGLFEELARERGALEQWLVPGTQTAPDAAERFDAIMVFGGSQHPDQDDDHPWIPAEVSFLREALDAGVPLLGVCLGAQLLARAADARVRLASAPEIGWHEIELTEAAAFDPVLGGLPAGLTGFQWHYYTYELPRGAVELASSRVARQAYRLGDRAWGIQFHAEVTREMVEAWLEDGAAELSKPAEEIAAETDALLGTWNAQGRGICGSFLDRAEAF